MIRVLFVCHGSNGNISLKRIQSLIFSLSGHAITISEGSIFHFLEQFAFMAAPASNRSDFCNYSADRLSCNGK